MFIVAAAGAGISSELGRETGAGKGSERARRNPGTQKKKKNLKTRDFVGGRRQRGATQKLEALKTEEHADSRFNRGKRAMDGSIRERGGGRLIRKTNRTRGVAAVRVRTHHQ